MKILFVASEGLPFSKTGGLADVVEALPKALVAMGHEVSVVLPRYRNTKASAVVLPSLTIPTGDGLRFPAVADGTAVAGVRYFFVRSEEHTSELQSPMYLVCRLLLEKKNKKRNKHNTLKDK